MQSILSSPRIQLAQRRVLAWLTAGISPRQLAFTLALGFAIGCIPLLGVTTAICALLAVALRLNMPAIQAANWLAMPVQMILLYPFLRFGQWLFAGPTIPFTRDELLAHMQTAPWHAVGQMGTLLGEAMLAWLVVAIPALLLLTLIMTPLMRRVSKIAAEAQ